MDFTSYVGDVWAQDDNLVFCTHPLIIADCCRMFGLAVDFSLAVLFVLFFAFISGSCSRYQRKNLRIEMKYSFFDAIRLTCADPIRSLSATGTPALRYPNALSNSINPGTPLQSPFLSPTSLTALFPPSIPPPALQIQSR